jgi:hypothetical protein
MQRPAESSGERDQASRKPKAGPVGKDPGGRGDRSRVGRSRCAAASLRMGAVADMFAGGWRGSGETAS